tara:strand:- start:85 stop:2406 length:2322 start_codon:yes stop_codon:yes gene_type:complete
MYNTYGGVIVFGVDDETRRCSGLNTSFDVEGFSDVVTDKVRRNIDFKSREYKLSDGSSVTALLVPQRGYESPARLQEKLDKYRVGEIWVRDRHSVRTLSEEMLPLIFSDRRGLFDDDQVAGKVSIHRTLPPSPATMREFIGREAMLQTLWEWLVFEDRPRFYLHGPGGSGKSTLAYEFSRQVSDQGHRIRLSKDHALDYVIFISAKETELNVYSAKEQPFYLRRFDDSISQFRAILVDAGALSASDARNMQGPELERQLSDLFDSFSGLIVIDDIDALSRAGKDTGEETLMLRAVQGARRTKILYTLRHPPSSAIASSLKVPGLERLEEFPRFISLFADQLELPRPSLDITKKIDSSSSRLPLLIETIIGLYAVCGSYEEALVQFDERGGDAARRYLYQREYDRLEKAGRAREVLAALFLLDEAVSFAVLSRILGFGDDSVRDAIGECGAIFLIAETDEADATRYKLAPPARGFIGAVSSDLKTFAALDRRVDLFLREDAAYTAEESSLIVEMEQLIRRKRYEDVIDLYEARPRSDPVLNNQKIQGIVGQAYAQGGPDARTKARECFEAAYRLKFIDVFMARAWFYVENESDYGSKNAIQVCEYFLSQPHLSARYRSEFKSKIASCYLEQARRLSSISAEKAIDFYKKSIISYLSALWIARYTQQIDEDLTLRWLSVPCMEFVDYLGIDLGPYFDLLMSLPDQRHDVHLDGAREIMLALRRSHADRDIQSRKRLLGLTKKAIRQLERKADEDEQPGLELVLTTLRVIESRLSA